LFAGDEPNLPSPVVIENAVCNSVGRQKPRSIALRQLAIACVCGVLSILSVLIGLTNGGPVGPWGYGYAKAVAYLWPILSAIAFGILWPTVTFTDFLIRLLSKRIGWVNRTEIFVVLPLGALFFTGAVKVTYPVIHPIILEREAEQKLLGLANSRSLDVDWATSFTNQYLHESRNGRETHRVKGGIAFSALLANPATPPELLRDIAEKLDPSASSWQTFAYVSNFSSEIAAIADRKGASTANVFILKWKSPQREYLEFFADSRHTEIRQQIAEAENTPVHILEKLSRDFECRALIAQNPSSPVHVLENLYFSKRTYGPTHDICRWLANNPTTPRHILEAIRNDHPSARFDLLEDRLLRYKTLDELRSGN
jgi:hypothetical protein